MCYKCHATQDGPRSWLGKGWRHTIKTHESYVADLAARGLPLPVILSIVTMCHEGVMPDVLHVVDCTISAHVCANVFVEVMQGFGRNQEEQLKVLIEDMNS